MVLLKVLVVAAYTIEMLLCQPPERICRQEDLLADLWRKKPGYKKDLESRALIMGTPRSLLEASRNCTVYNGTIKIKEYSSEDFGFEEYVRHEDLLNLRNLRVIYGALYLNLKKYPGIKSLSFLSNLRLIQTSDKLGFTLIYSQVEKICFVNVRLNVPRIGIGYNKHLCYLEHIRTINRSSDFILKFNKDPKKCAVEGEVCSPSCNPDKGCWGPRDRHCFECRHWRAGSDCVDSCESRRDFYKPSAGRVCGRCHGECKFGCFGPRKTECFFRPQRKRDCPGIMYFDEITRECEECSPECLGEGFDNRTLLSGRACSGPGNHSGPKGCSHRCPASTFLTIASGILECSLCHAGCLWCRNGTSSGCVQWKAEQDPDRASDSKIAHPAGAQAATLIVVFIVVLLLGLVMIFVLGRRKRRRGRSMTGIEAGMPLMPEGRPAAAVQLLVQFSDTDVSPVSGREEIEAQGMLLSLSYIKCRIPRMAAGPKTFEELRGALGPLFAGEEIRAISQWRAKVAQKEAVLVTSRDAGEEARDCPFCDEDGKEYSWRETRNRQEQTNDAGSLRRLVVCSGRRTVLRISHNPPAVKLFVVYHPNQFSIDVTRPEVQSLSQFSNSDRQFLKCLVPGLSSGRVPFHDVRKALQPLFADGDIRGIVQVRASVDGATVAFVAHRDGDEEKKGSPGYDGIDGRHYSKAVQEETITAIIAPGDDEMEMKMKRLNAVDRGGDILITQGERRTVLHIHSLRSDIFLSYHHDSEIAVLAILKNLEAKGFSCWMNNPSVEAGDVEVKNCKVMLACVTGKYLDSLSCTKEIVLAHWTWRHSQSAYPVILPLLLEDMRWPPTDVDWEVRKILRRKEAFRIRQEDVRDWRGRRIDTLETELGRIIGGVDLLVTFDDGCFSPTDRPEIKERGRHGTSSFVKCRVPRLTGGWKTFEELRHILGPLFAGEKIRMIEQCFGKVAGNEAARVTTLGADEVTEPQKSPYCDVEGREYSQEETERPWFKIIHARSLHRVLIISGRRTVLGIAELPPPPLYPPFPSSSSEEEESTTRRRSVPLTLLHLQETPIHATSKKDQYPYHPESFQSGDLK